MNNEYVKNFAAVKSAVKIEDVIATYIDLKPEGAGFTACCPFHHEKSASFKVSPAKQVFSCFGCGVSGDAIKFVELYEKIKPYEAMEKIAKANHLAITGSDAGQSELSPYYEANIFACQAFYQSFLSASGEVKRWVMARGITSREVLVKWQIGYGGNNNVVPTDRIEQAKELGLLNANGNCAFANRIIFPLVAANGKMVGFSGRSLDPKPKVKYINSSDSKIFHKSDFIYGLYYALKGIRANDCVVITEGYFDCILMHEIGGAPNTVATCGTALTDAQAKTLSQYTSHAVLMYDGDMWKIPEKLKRIEAALLKLWANRFEVTLLRCPEQTDPAELCQLYGEDAVAACSTVNPIEFFQVHMGYELPKVIECLGYIKNTLIMQRIFNDLCPRYDVLVTTAQKLVREQINKLK